jgi:predicted membrane channel-forming protein YqfA (hemolysin III family)
MMDKYQKLEILGFIVFIIGVVIIYLDFINKMPEDDRPEFKLNNKLRYIYISICVYVVGYFIYQLTTGSLWNALVALWGLYC